MLAGGAPLHGERLAARGRAGRGNHGRARLLTTPPDPDLRLVALDHLVGHDRHEERHLDLALELASGWIGLDYDRTTQIADALVSGWPGHQRLRDASWRPSTSTIATARSNSAGCRAARALLQRRRRRP
jgi:hypothetical protein